MFKTQAQRLAIACLILLLTILSTPGCGFQPRGQAMSLVDVPSPVNISGVSPYSELYRELYRQLKVAGAAIAPSSAESASTLHLSDVDTDTRLLSVNSRNKAVEYELIEEATFSLRAAGGQELVAPQRISVLRIQYRPEDDVLGSDRGAKLLRRDMVEDLAGRIVRRLTAQRKVAE